MPRILEFLLFKNVCINEFIGELKLFHDVSFTYHGSYFRGLVDPESLPKGLIRTKIDC